MRRQIVIGDGARLRLAGVERAGAVSRVGDGVTGMRTLGHAVGTGIERDVRARRLRARETGRARAIARHVEREAGSDLSWLPPGPSRSSSLVWYGEPEMVTAELVRPQSDRAAICPPQASTGFA